MENISCFYIINNLLDNAIEAVSKLEASKWIHISLKKHNNFLVICESNPCKGNIDIVDNAISTTKKNFAIKTVSGKEVENVESWNRQRMTTRHFLLLFFVLLMSFSVGCGRKKNDNSTEFQREETSQSDTAKTTVTREDLDRGTTENEADKEQRIAIFDFQKNCDAVEGKTGLYELRKSLDANCYFVASLKEKILFAYWDELDWNQDSLIGELRLELYDPTIGESVKCITESNLQSVFIVAAKDQVGVLDSMTKKMYVYDENLECTKVQELPANMDIYHVVSDNLRYVAGIENGEKLNVCVYDLQEQELISIDLGGNGGYSIHGILKDDIVVIREEDFTTKRYYYSLSKRTLVDMASLDSFDTGIWDYGDQYFTSYLNEAQSGLYYGEFEGTHHVLYGEFLYEDPVWFYRGNEVVLQGDHAKECQVGEGNPEEQITEYGVDIWDIDLATGNQKGTVCIPLQRPYEEQMVICHYVDYYNLAFVTIMDPNSGKTKCYVVDVNSMQEDTPAYEVFLVDERTVTDYGDLQPLREQADALERQYDIQIRLGQECRFQNYWTYNCDIVTDYDTIKTGLQLIEEQLQIYPSNYFQQLQIEEGNPVIFYLVGGIFEKEDAENQLATCGAFTSYGDNHSFVVFDISEPSYSFVWHETMHLTNIKFEHSKSLDVYDYYAQWEALNPSDFEWTGMDVYSENANPYERYWVDGSAYFINDYGMTNYEEDSATIMEQNLMDAYPFCRQSPQQDEPVYRKLDLLCDTIRQVFDTTGWPEVLPWEEVRRSQ